MTAQSQPSQRAGTAAMTEDERLDRANEESFPASDPPNVTPGQVGAGQPEPAPPPAPLSADEPPRRENTMVQQVIVVVVALILMAGVVAVA